MAIALVVMTGCSPQGADNAEEEVLALIRLGEAAWNDGSIEGYMETYWKSPDLRFASGGRVTYGWQSTLDGYLQRYPDRAAMGRLEFTDLQIAVLSDDAALAFGAWRLVRAEDEPHGLFTLQINKFEEGWRIVADHTSSAD
jgi:hypothetical protein